VRSSTPGHEKLSAGQSTVTRPPPWSTPRSEWRSRTGSHQPVRWSTPITVPIYGLDLRATGACRGRRPVARHGRRRVRQRDGRIVLGKDETELRDRKKWSTRVPADGSPASTFRDSQRLDRNVASANTDKIPDLCPDEERGSEPDEGLSSARESVVHGGRPVVIPMGRHSGSSREVACIGMGIPAPVRPRSPATASNAAPRT
jgi:hypothetical protein